MVRILHRTVGALLLLHRGFPFLSIRLPTTIPPTHIEGTQLHNHP